MTAAEYGLTPTERNRRLEDERDAARNELEVLRAAVERVIRANRYPNLLWREYPELADEIDALGHLLPPNT